MCSKPESADLDAVSPVFVKVQEFFELRESDRTFSGLNTLSKNGSAVNIRQKNDRVRVILNAWREQVPTAHEYMRNGFGNVW